MVIQNARAYKDTRSNIFCPFAVLCYVRHSMFIQDAHVYKDTRMAIPVHAPPSIIMMS